MRGFTLIELLVVIVLSTILVGIAIPAFSDFQNNQTLNSALNDVVTLVHTAQSYANSNSKPSSCNGYTLAAYEVQTVGQSMYQLLVVCTNGTQTITPVTVQKTLPSPIHFKYSTTVTFTILHGGSSGGVFSLINPNNGKVDTVGVDTQGIILSE